jgi:hypothetical protein
MGMGRKRRDAFNQAHPYCIFCGGTEPATTIEHCPPRAMFRYRQWPEGFEFPACSSCNHGSADDDLIISLLARLDPIGGADQDGKFLNLVGSINQRFPKLIKKMLPTAIESRRLNREIGLSPRPGATHQDSCIAKITEEMESAIAVFAAKLAKGIYYIEAGVPFPAEGFLAAKWYPNLELVMEGRYKVFDALAELGGAVPEMRRGRSLLNDQFSYKISLSEDKDLIAVQAQFGRGFALVIIGSSAPGKLEDMFKDLKETVPTKRPFVVVHPNSKV